MTIDDLLDRAQITEALMRYAQGVDRRDWDAVRAAYHDDAYDDHGPYKGGVDGLVDWISGRHESIAQSMHLIGNVVIDLDGDTARSDAYCLVFQRQREDAETTPAMFENAHQADEGAPTIEICCRYVDEMQRRDGVWRISHRTVVYEWMWTAVRDEVSLIQPDWARATRDRTDPVYARWDQ
ncbi:MAG: nuclear transport factor 2 family protein [Actinomycetota bacterium]